jgi:hypothetical protein
MRVESEQKQAERLLGKRTDPDPWAIERGLRSNQIEEPGDDELETALQRLADEGPILAVRQQIGYPTLSPENPVKPPRQGVHKMVEDREIMLFEELVNSHLADSWRQRTVHADGGDEVEIYFGISGAGRNWLAGERPPVTVASMGVARSDAW